MSSGSTLNSRKEQKRSVGKEVLKYIGKSLVKCIKMSLKGKSYRFWRRNDKLVCRHVSTCCFQQNSLMNKHWSWCLEQVCSGSCCTLAVQITIGFIQPSNGKKICTNRGDHDIQANSQREKKIPIQNIYHWLNPDTYKILCWI